MKGRKPIPTALKILSGERRPERLALDSPQPATGQPRKPDDLGAIASAKWDELCRLLADVGVLTVADGEPIEQYVRTYECWRKCEALMRRGGAGGGCFAVNGRQVKAPARLFKDLTGLLCRLEAELGLTPSSRSRVRAVKTDEPKGKLAKYVR